MDQNNLKLIIFDVDGTLADRDTSVLLPGVREWFDHNRDAFKIALATNQGGVGLRHWMETEGFGEPEKFPDELQLLGHLNSVIDALDTRVLLLVCFAYQSKKSGKWGPTPAGREKSFNWQPKNRKPAPGMLLAAMKAAEVEPAQTLMVGDRDEDREAAEAAGVRFIHAAEFFGRQA